MCYWGIAFALGPNINAPITEDAAKQAFQAIEDARARRASISENERAYIDALAKRYTANPKAERAPLDAAYAAAMRNVVRGFPDDLDAATLFAQSLMDTSPWNYWNSMGPRTFTNEVLASLESVLKRKADHLGAIHLYIHAVEASPDPWRAEQHADKLPALAPGAGHLVHMPAHIYLRVGRYEEASTANQRAIKATKPTAGDAVAGNMMYQVGYLPHNFHFFVTSASMEGRRAAREGGERGARENACRDAARPVDGRHGSAHAVDAALREIRFGMWTEVLAEPAHR
jgi:tetratricopeptide (TPR) repeat protein